jgi:hypothetical protein
LNDFALLRGVNNEMSRLALAQTGTPTSAARAGSTSGALIGKDREQLRESPFRGARESGIADEVDGKERVRDRLSRRLRVLLTGGERSRGGVGNGVKGEAKREPRDHERHVAAELCGCIEYSCKEQCGGQAAHECQLCESEQPDPDHLAREQAAGCTVDRMISTTRLFFSSRRR